MARTGRDSRGLPTGTLTFLFSDIEGSTRLVAALGPRYTTILERHQAILRTAFGQADGVEVATEGDSFFVVFRSALSAVTAAAAAQLELAGEPWPSEVGSLRVRMGLHTGEGTRGGDNYVGLDVHRAARISAAAHGGQVLMSDATRALAVGSLPVDLRLLDLGEYRLKDLERPERLVQLVVPGLQADFAPPRTLETPSNLPAMITSFVGRQREVDEITRLVRGSRLVTLVGPGGSGKTRLSLRVAEGLRPEFGAGTFFVDLSTIDDAELIPTTIAHAVGIRQEATRPVVDSLKDHLRDLRLLLVLDNFEQVMPGVALVGDLLRAAPSIAILVTSRVVLHLSGEQEYAVPSLDTPDPRQQLPPLEELRRYDAVVLFVERARQVRPDFQVDAGNASAVAAICARLDGLPLPIELAAARVKILAPDAILARLDKRLALLTSSATDLPARQRTLRGAIDWSHELLDPTERLLFRRLAVFVGGCTIDDAQAVCDPDGQVGIDMLDGLASLVDKSLLRQSRADAETRFGMLESIREYALERLADSEDLEPVRARHEDRFAELTTQAEPELLGPKAKAWLDRLDAERDNLRAAGQNAADDGRLDLALGMAAAQWRFWQQRGQLAEGRLMLEGLLGREAALAGPEVRAKALAAVGGVTYWQGDLLAADRAYADALEIERTLHDPAGLADALYNAGFVAAISGHREAARADYEESLALYQGMGEQLGVVKLREALAFLLFHEGDFDGARTLQEENLRVAREGAEPFRIANALNQLLAIQLKQPDFKGAHESGAEALRVFRSSGDMHGVIRVLILSAAVAVAEGDPERAARLSGVADLLKEPLGNVATPMQILGIRDPAETSRELLGDEAFQAAYVAGRGLTLDEAIDLVQA